MAKAWDFIIVGAGSAGCVLAERLSADASVSVLLIEEGPDADDWLIRMPLGFAKTLGNPQRATYAVTHHDRRVDGGKPDIWMRGKLLGGSSALNGMVWMRGQPEDWDRFSELGLKGWSWREMLPHFKALEDHELGADDLRGTGGPIAITTTRPAGPLGEAVIAAGEALGLPRKIDQNRLEQEGLGYLQVNIDRRGRRVSAARAFLQRARSRPNLTILPNTRIDRVVFDGRRASAVDGRSSGSPVRYFAAGEIILSAGTLASPAILQRSGIGPAQSLSSLGIPVLQESPGVGRNMREHWLLQLQFRLRSPAHSANRSLRGLRLFGNVARYLVSGTGPLAAGPYHIGGFIRAFAGSNRPDAQIMFMPMSQDESGGDGLETEPGMQLFAYQCRPESLGSLEITSADPDAPLRIDPNYLATAGDRRAAVEMIRFARRLAATPPLRDFIVGETARTAGAQSDEEILAAFARFGQAGYHACGTCKMGNDALSVTDERVRVRGVEGLRIMDLSVAPEMFSANTNAPVIAMASRASDLILEDLKAKRAGETTAIRHSVMAR